MAVESRVCCPFLDGQPLDLSLGVVLGIVGLEGVDRVFDAALCVRLR